MEKIDLVLIAFAVTFLIVGVQSTSMTAIVVAGVLVALCAVHTVIKDVLCHEDRQKLFQARVDELQAQLNEIAKTTSQNQSTLGILNRATPRAR